MYPASKKKPWKSCGMNTKSPDKKRPGLFYQAGTLSFQQISTL